MLCLQAVEVKAVIGNVIGVSGGCGEAENFVAIYYRWNQLKIDIEKTSSGDFWYGIRYFHYQNINLIKESALL